jgi:putative inorganic carbon (HCO3(-)) transporter
MPGREGHVAAHESSAPAADRGTVLSTFRLEAAARRPDGTQALALLGLGAVAALLVAGSVAMPQTTLLLAAAAVALVILVTRIDLAILLVVATAPLEGAFASGPAGVSVTKLAGYVCIGAFAYALVKERRRLVFEPGQAIVLGILGIAMLSTAWADDASAGITTTTRYASFAAIYVIITQFGYDRVLQRRIAWTLTVTCTIAAALGLNDYLRGDAQLATLPHAQANDFAFILATSLPFMFFLLGGTRALRPLLLAAIALVSAALLLSLSRGAFLGLAAGFVVFVLTDRRRLQVTLTAGALAAIGTLLVIHSNPQRFHEAVTLKQNVAQENVSTRFGAWSAAARLASDHPLLGVGPGNFQFHYNDLTGQPLGTLTLTVAHNALLDVGAELGLVAMALLALYLILAFVRLSSALQLGYGDPGFVRALRIALTIAIVGAMFLSEQYFLPFWLIGGLAAAIWVNGRRPAGEIAGPTPE